MHMHNYFLFLYILGLCVIIKMRMCCKFFPVMSFL